MVPAQSDGSKDSPSGDHFEGGAVVIPVSWVFQEFSTGTEEVEQIYGELNLGIIQPLDVSSILEAHIG